MEDAASGRAWNLRMSMAPELSHAEVARVAGADRASASTAGVIRQVSGLEEADSHSAVFARTLPALQVALASPAACILADQTLRETPDSITDERILWVSDARTSFALLADHLRSRPAGREIAATAEVAAGAHLGDRTTVGPGAVIEAGVTIGEACTIHARVVIHAGTRLGNRVTVQSGAVLGSTGFGYVRAPGTGKYVLFPQQGTLAVEDDVDIGANTTIDRGALGETRIGAGTKIDNLVHIAHNCIIGRNVIIAAQTGIAGSSRIGDDAIIAGQVGIADHVEIGEGVVLGAKAGVPSRKRLHGAGQVFWGIPARPIQQYLRELAKLRRSL